jgi:ubiquinone/menaquinone biosynthesis C-methylase UbiE
MSVSATAIKERQKAAWAMGDLQQGFGLATPIVGELLSEAVDVHGGERVLDVGCGTRNAALAAARRGANVTGVDIVAAALEHAHQRFSVEGLTGSFVEAEAESLPFSNESFDVVLSTFGVMFAPDQEKVASELLRVCRSGGRIGLANWIPEGTTAALGKLLGNTCRRHPLESALRSSGVPSSACESYSRPAAPPSRRIDASSTGGRLRSTSWLTTSVSTTARRALWSRRCRQSGAKLCVKTCWPCGAASTRPPMGRSRSLRITWRR